MNKIEGIPGGWELVRIGTAEVDEWYIDCGGRPHYCVNRVIGGCAIIKRIEPTYRPFANAAEFAPHRNKWVKSKLDASCYPNRVGVVVQYDDERAYFTNGDVSAGRGWDYLFQHMLFEDGTPFGYAIEDGIMEAKKNGVTND